MASTSRRSPTVSEPETHSRRSPTVSEPEEEPASKRRRLDSEDVKPVIPPSPSRDAESQLDEAMPGPSQLTIPEIKEEPDQIDREPSHPPTTSKGKGKEKAVYFKSSRTPTPEPPPPPPLKEPSLELVEPESQPTQTVVEAEDSGENDLTEFTCPICFSPPTAATLTPCGHIMCGACLFSSVESAANRARMHGYGGEALEAKCPVCRALLKDWDGRGGGVVGLEIKIRR